MKGILTELIYLEISLIPISSHIEQLKESASPLVASQFMELEDKIVEMKRIIGMLRSCVVPPPEVNRRMKEKVKLQKEGKS